MESFSVRSDSLKCGATRCCSVCSHEKTSKAILQDLTGITFGRLTVIKRAESYISPTSGRKTAKWLCKCECGNMVCIKGSSLKNKNTTSCGCQSESKIASDLKAYCFQRYSARLEYPLFKNPETKRNLICDIFIKMKINVFIEVHGSQHYRITNYHYKQAKRKNTTPEEEFKKQKHRDRIKKKYCKDNGHYIEVNLLKIKTTEDAIEYIEKELDKIRN
jgi:hypothetical protein